MSFSRAILSRRLATPSLARQPVHHARSSRRNYASIPSPAEALPKSSDLPWAVGSVIIFGSLFVYLTAPPKKGGSHGHGGHGPEATERVLEKTRGVSDDAHARYEDPQKLQESSDDHPTGNQLLASEAISLQDSHDRESNKPQRDGPAKKDNLNFQSGVEHSKDGDHISDPKKVVAAAQTARQEKKENKE